METHSITKTVVDRFVAGETTETAVTATTRLTTAGRLATIDVLGEDVTSKADARATRDEYMRLLYGLSEAGCTSSAEVSIKLSAIGLSLAGGEDVALRHAREICLAAEAVGCLVTLDMEDHTTVGAALRIGTELRRDHPLVGNVLQANLRRTSGDIEALQGTSTRIRIVKGAYREPAKVAYQRKHEVDAAYERAIELLMRSCCYPMVATHDAAMIDLARRSAREAGRSSEEWEVQMLYGIRQELQRDVVARNERLRVYIPYGTDWYGYFMRRLAERPANVAFFLRALAGN